MNKTMIAKFDRVFSEYIRLRDSDDNGYCTCISCNKIAYYKDMDAGHYINRKHMSTRYDEFNVHSQCRSCNRFDEGNSVGYARGLINKYNGDILDLLIAKKFNHNKLHDFEAQALIDHYRVKIKEFKQKKSLK